MTGTVSILKRPACYLTAAVRSTRGAALIITLLVVALLTTMVGEFAYGVYMDLSAFDNWQKSQRLSLAARSGVKVAAELTAISLAAKQFTYPAVVLLPAGNPFEGSGETLTLKITDENSKFNLNTLVHPNGLMNEEAVEAFKRLLGHLELSEDIAYSLADWMDTDSEPLMGGSEDGAKNAPLESPDEMVLVPGVGRDIYDKLRPHVTVWGNGLININGAGAPVLASLDSEIDKEMAERVIKYRELTPFERTTDIGKVAGFKSLGISLLGRTTVKSSAQEIVSMAELEGIRRTIRCVLDTDGKAAFWKEI